MNYLDILLLFFMVWGAWKGYRAGFISLITGWISYLVGGLVAASYSRPLAENVDQTWHLSFKWASHVAVRLPLPKEVLNQPVSIPAVRQAEAVIADIPLPEIIKQSLIGSLDKYPGVTIGHALAAQIVFLCIVITAGVVLFFAAIILLRRLAQWVTVSNRLPFLGFINRMMGMALGFTSQVFWMSLLVGIGRNLLTLPAVTQAPGMLPLARQLYASPVAGHLGTVYDWMAAMLYTLF